MIMIFVKVLRHQSLDFKKGFDTINHHFFCLLEELRFKESFIRWIQTLYNNANGKVINYGWISEKFSIKRGVRQGCPLSALFFIIVAEIVAAKVIIKKKKKKKKKKKSKIKGITVPNPDLDNPETMDIRITQFADDNTIFADSVNSVNEVMKEVEIFGDNAGPKF